MKQPTLKQRDLSIKKHSKPPRNSVLKAPPQRLQYRPDYYATYIEDRISSGAEPSPTATGIPDEPPCLCCDCWHIYEFIHKRSRDQPPCDCPNWHVFELLHTKSLDSPKASKTASFPTFSVVQIVRTTLNVLGDYLLQKWDDLGGYLLRKFDNLSERGQSLVGAFLISSALMLMMFMIVGLYALWRVIVFGSME